MNSKEMQMPEVELNILDMLAAVLRKWRIVVLVAILMAAIVGGIDYYSRSKEYNNNKSGEALAAAKSLLNEVDQKEVEQLYAGYKTYNEKITNLQNYVDGSVIMHMDYNNVSSISYEYLIKADQDNIISSFSSMSLGDEEYQKIADIYGENVDARYIYEVVEISGSTGEGGYAVDASGESNSLLGEGSILPKYSGIMKLNITAETKKQCEEVYAVAKSAIDNHISELEKAGVEVSVREIANNYKQSYRKDLADLQQEKISEKTELLTKQSAYYKENISSLPELKKNYFDLLKESERIEEKEIKVNLVSAVLGFILGAIIVVMVIIVVYLANGKIKTKEELQKLTGKATMASVKMNRGYKLPLNMLINKWADLWEGGRYVPVGTDAVKLAAAKMVQEANNQKVENVFVICQNETKNAKKVLSELKEECGKKKIEVTYGNPDMDSKAYGDYVKAASVCFLCELKSTTKEYANEYRIGMKNSDNVFLENIILQNN